MTFIELLGIEIIGETGDGEEAVELVDKLPLSNQVGRKRIR
jgi:hypothetical protein